MPLAYTSNELSVPEEDQLCHDKLLDPLEWFICNGDPKIVIQQLKKTDSPPQLCGRVFKMGEPTYSCRSEPSMTIKGHVALDWSSWSIKSV